MNFAFEFDFEGEDSGSVAVDANKSEFEEKNEKKVAVLEEAKFVEAPELSDIPYYELPLACNDRKIRIYAQEGVQGIVDKGLVYDVVPNVYEGGHSIWECSLDLANYLVEHYEAYIAQLKCSKEEGLSTLSVLELGCGQGLPGCCALNLGFQHVVFTDYNYDVILNTTWSNAILNAENDFKARVTCYSGDWLSVSELMIQNDNRCFDIILAAETLYTMESCEKMLAMLDTHLSEDGIAILATKRYYFGVGGGTAAFQDMNNKRNKRINSNQRLNIEIVKSIEDGVSNIRDILTVKKSK